jgi:hypothetical protein
MRNPAFSVFIPCLFAGVALAGLVLAPGCSSPAQCTTVPAAPVTVQPETTCLVIDVSLTTGCGAVAPQLTVVNDCTDPLVIDGASVELDGPSGPVAQDAGSVSVAPGATGVVDVEGTAGTPQATLHGTLGTQALVLTFATQ